MKGKDDPEAVSYSGESLQDSSWKLSKALLESSDNCQAKKGAVKSLWDTPSWTIHFYYVTLLLYTNLMFLNQL